MKILLLYAAVLSGDYTSYTFAPGNPYDIPGKEEDFRYSLSVSGALGREHPFLSVTEKELKAARSRTDHQALSARKAVIAAARQALQLSFPAPSEAWYEPLRGKRFGLIYSEVYRRTAWEPQRVWKSALALARAWALTRRAEYAEAVVRLLRSWSSYPFGVEHYDMGLNYAVWGLMALECYDLVFDKLGAEDHKKLAGFFSRFLGAVMRNDCFWIENSIGGGLNNHLAWHKYAACATGLFYRRKDIVRFAVQGARSIPELAERGLRDGGIWLEGSIPYHLTAQYPIVSALNLLKRCGVEIRPFANGYTPASFFTGIYELVLPDLTLPPLGDAYGRRPYLPDAAPWHYLRGSRNEALAFAMLARRRKADPWITLFFQQERAGTPPPPPSLKSKLFPEHGYVVLRSPEGPPNPSGSVLLATYDATGVHSHADKLSFMLYSGGRLWLEDREGLATSVHAFSADIQRTLNRYAVCHNTLIVDWKNQRPLGRKLDMLGFVRAEGHARVTIGDLQGLLYPGVKQLRSFILTRRYAVDVLQVLSDREAEFLLPMHVAGKPVRKPQGLKPVKLPEGRPWNWLRRAGGVETGSSFDLTFADGQGRRLHVKARSSLPGKLVFADFPADDTRRKWRPVVFELRRGKRVVFIHLFSFEGRPAALKWKEIKGDGLLGVEVRPQGGEAPDRYLLPLLQ